MNYLKLHTEPTICEHTFRVLAWTGHDKVHMINVKIDRTDKLLSYEDRGIAAELCATHFLLTEKNVFGENFSGSGLGLKVSSKKVLSVIKSKDKNKVDGYGRFLKIRFGGSEIDIDDEIDWRHSDEIISESSIERFGPPRCIIDTDCLGRVVITEHAIDRYDERNHSGKAKSNYKSLCKRLQNKELIQIKLDDRLRVEKLIKYANKYNGTGEMWKHKRSTTHLVTTEPSSSGLRYLLTVFVRRENQELKANES